jgi:hypothetical protein
MDQVSEVLRYYHYAYRTEQTYCHLSAGGLVFLYRDVLDKTLAVEIAPVRSKRQPRPPTVFTQTR